MPFDPNNIDDRFVNVDFVKEAKRVGRLTGYAGINPAAIHKFGAFGDSVPVLSDSELRSEIEKMDAAGGGSERLITRIYDQNGEGSCVANACSQANEVVQALQWGKENVVHLSAMSLYKRIGSSPNSGAMVSDGLEEMQSRGVLPLDNAENRAKYGDAVMPNIGWRTAFPSGWETTAAKFKVKEAYIVRNVNELLTALVHGWPVVVGRSGHSICHIRPLIKSGSFAALYANSWGNWGQGAGDFTSGFGVDAGGTLRSAAGWAFAVRSLTVSQ